MCLVGINFDLEDIINGINIMINPRIISINRTTVAIVAKGD
jgi:hypothetical protein